MKLTWPLPAGIRRISQRFGERPLFAPDYYSQWGYPGHPALDIACPVGTPVSAAHDGWADPRWNGILGDHVRLQSDDGTVLTRYSHLSRVDVQYGQRVSKGACLGLSGNSGKVTGPHLDFALKVDGISNPAYRGWIDPEPWLEKGGAMTKTSLHVQRVEPWMQQAIRDLGSDWVKLVNPPAGPDPMPRIKNKLVRIWTDNIDPAYIADGEKGGRAFVRRMLHEWRLRSWATCYSLANEPACNSNKELWNLRGYSIGAMEEARREGITLVVLECAEGNPHDNGTGDEDVTKWKVQQLAPAVDVAIALGHYVGRHAYWRPEVEGPLGRYHALGRVIRDVGYWADAGVLVGGLHLLLTEWGVDGGIAGHTPKQGWRDVCPSPSMYFREVAEGERAARALPWLEAMFLFDAGFEEPWGGYNHDSHDLRSIIAVMPPTSPPPIEGALTEAEYAKAKGFFESSVPATLKDAISRNRMFVAELPDAPNIYISWDPSYNRYEVNKLNPQTWEHIGDKPL